MAALLKDGDSFIAARAAWLLAQMGDEGIASVKPWLESKDAAQRLVAYRALRRADHDVPAMAARMASDSDAAVRRARLAASLAVRQVLRNGLGLLGVSAPERMAERIATVQAAISKATNPLPGSVPFENRRPVNVPAAYDGYELLDALTAIFPQISREEWEARCDAGRFVNYGGTVRGKTHVVRGGERVVQIFPPDVEPPVSADIRVLHEDEAILLVHKPAPLPMHASGRFHRNTLQYILNEAYAPKYPRPVHRLDSNTTGLVLFARTRHFSRVLQRQFIEGTVDKRYLVRAQGHPGQDVFFSESAISSEPDVMGTRTIDEENGLASRTDFTVIQRCADGTSLLEAKLGTGRTNQIRLHLWELGMPVVGDPAYLPDRKIGDTQTLTPDDAPLQLHAWKLTFRHPLSGEVMAFETERPQWASLDDVDR